MEKTPIFNSFPLVKGKDVATNLCHSDFVAFPSLVGERVRVRAKNQ
ncbi:MAG: hypothetical protein LBQ59_04285 [Candidatus Peribacteria bacterium]|nr:hypothetical protein [Candidatus Peribacteria bacterium]